MRGHKRPRHRSGAHALTLDGRAVSARPGATILEVCLENAVPVPTLCWSPGLLPVGGCRVCLVECNGAVAAACTAPAPPGAAIRTQTPLLRRLRRIVVELILSELGGGLENAPAPLQALAESVGVAKVRHSGATKPASRDERHPYIAADWSKCVLCRRCVQVCETAGPAVFAVKNRGFDSAIVAGLDNAGLQAAGCIACGACADACPTGALRENKLALFRLAALAPPQLLALSRRADGSGPGYPYVLAEPVQWPPASSGETAGLGIHPADAEALGLRDGAPVEAAGLRGSIRARIVATAHVPRGLLWLVSLSHAAPPGMLAPLPPAEAEGYRAGVARLRPLSEGETALPPDDSMELRPVRFPGQG